MNHDELRRELENCRHAASREALLDFLGSFVVPFLLVAALYFVCR